MMASATRFIVFFVGLCLVVDANTIDVCKHEPPIKEDFELSKIAGRWYEFARYPNIFQNSSIVRCYSTFVTVESNDILRATTTYIEKHGTSEEKRSFESKLTGDPHNPGKVLFTIPFVGLNDTFNIVDAKYDDYLVHYICKASSFNKTEMAWVITREAQLSDAKKKSLLEKLKSLKIDTERLEFDSNENCYFSYKN